VIHRPNETRLAVARWFLLSRFELPAEAAIEKIGIMKITKNIGMLLLAVYLIVDGLLGFGLNLGPAIFLLYLVALAAGIFILIGK
jgi:NAD(P)H-hydrate repair Nnr-like enzyme with NAD(P)H-hydrate epimerase domain